MTHSEQGNYSVGGLVSAVRGNWRGGGCFRRESYPVWRGGEAGLVYFNFIGDSLRLVFFPFSEGGRGVFAYLLTFSDPLIWKWDERRARQIGIYSLFILADRTRLGTRHFVLYQFL